MSSDVGRAVFKYKGIDCWRTWFINECEQSELFGVTLGHLNHVKTYRAGSLIYLEDAPWFSRGRKVHHRICGPYEVVATDSLPKDARPIDPDGNKVIVYEEAHPEKGPWNDGIVSRDLNGKNVDVMQTASTYKHYPYRFGIRHANNWEDDSQVKLKNN